jgi:uncharacterized phage-associated protein
MYNALDIAKYFIKLASPEEEDFITNLKLQKLLYYAQGFYLALHKKPLFSEQVRAWQYGPVVTEVYYNYKEHSVNTIPQPDDFDIEQYDQETRELLDEVYEVYGQYKDEAMKSIDKPQIPAGVKNVVRDYFQELE